MKYYLYRPDADSFAGIGFNQTHDDLITSIHYTDICMLPQWNILGCQEIDDNPTAQGDFPSLTNFWRIPVFSHRAWIALRPLIEYCCEALPIVCKKPEACYIVHIMDTIDCLDVDHSDVIRFKNGNIMRIKKYCFIENMINKKMIFKLPVKSGGEVIVNEVFRKAVETNGLKGLLFRELPMVDRSTTMP